MSKKTTLKRNKIKKRIRKVVFGSKDKPRLSVFRSNKEIYAQIIDDVNSITIVAASSVDKDLKLKTTNKIEISKIVGDSIAKKAIKAGVKKVSFDRNGYLYHGRVKSLADGAREAGLNF
jgi:large subunit ribosomal protein L18